MNYHETLSTERLVLRPLSLSDFEAVHSWASNAENVRYMLWGPNSEDETKAFLNAATPGKDFAVVLESTSEVIGSCGIYPDGASDTAEIGWILHMDYWKQGYGAELCRELIRYGFKDLNLRRVFASCAAMNHGSYKIMERNGMHREALHIKARWDRVDMEWIDNAVYAMLSDEHGKETDIMKVVVIQQHTGEGQFPTFSEGAKVTITGYESNHFFHWFPCRIEGRDTFVPKSFIADGALTRDYNPTELIQNEGDVLEVVEIVNAWLIAKNSDGQVGWIPAEAVVSLGG